MRRRPLLALALALVPACTPSGDAQAVEAMIEVKLEMRMAIDELKTARSNLDDARAEIDRARADLDRSRLALNKALDRAAVDPLADGDAPPVPVDPDRTLAPELLDGIVCAEESVCTIKRSVVDALLANPEKLTKQARIVPSIRDGEPQGMKFYGIRPGTLMKAIGIKNGDLVRAVNGKPLTNVEEMMNAYTTLRSAKKFDLVGERKGQPYTWTVTVVDG